MTTKRIKKEDEFIWTDEESDDFEHAYDSDRDVGHSSRAISIVMAAMLVAAAIIVVGHFVI